MQTYNGCKAIENSGTNFWVAQDVYLLEDSEHAQFS